MNYGESDEQQMIRELVRDFAESVLAPTAEHRDANQIPPSEEWCFSLTICGHSIKLIVFLLSSNKFKFLVSSTDFNLNRS